MDPSSEILPTTSFPETASAPQELPAPQNETVLPEVAQTAISPESGASRINQMAQPPQTAVPPLSLPPVVAQPPVSDTKAQDIVGPIPVIADDVDVIEKEWVDKAKKIVEQTKSDPYRQEQAVEQLQRSYLKKRYNKDLKSPNN